MLLVYSLHMYTGYTVYTVYPVYTMYKVYAVYTQCQLPTIQLSTQDTEYELLDLEILTVQISLFKSLPMQIFTSNPYEW